MAADERASRQAARDKHLRLRNNLREAAEDSFGEASNDYAHVDALPMQDDDAHMSASQRCLQVRYAINFYAVPDLPRDREGTFDSARA